MKYNVLDTREHVLAVLNYPAWTAYARLPGREDWPIYDATGVREDHGGMQINFGEYDSVKGRYLNEEWLAPAMVYIKHQCDGCHYPPSMCCLQPESFRSGDEYDYGGYLEGWAPTDEDIMASDEYEAAEQALWASPPIVFRIVEL